MIEYGPEPFACLKLLAALQHNEIVIPKTGYNSFGKYNYSTLDDILGTIQKYLSEYHCVIMWSEDTVNHDKWDREYGDKYEYHLFTEVVTTCRLQCIDNTEDWISTQSHGAGINKNADKTCKATTISKRYSLINLLALQSVNEEDTDNDLFEPRESFTNQEELSARMSFKERMQQRKTSTKRSQSKKLV